MRAFLLQTFLVVFCFAISTNIAAAQGEEVFLVPNVIDASEPIRAALQENKGYTSTTIHGKGASLHLQYSASENITFFLVPIAANKSYVPNDTVLTVLPKGERQNVRIDLTVSPGWSPWQEAYMLQMLTPSKEADASFFEVDFFDTSIVTTIKAAIQHFWTLEPYSPSSYHALRGYRILGISMPIIAGIFVIICSMIMLVLHTKISASLLPNFLIIATLFIAARSTIDDVRFSKQHLSEYFTKGTYDEAGSIFTIAEFLKANTDSDAKIYVCREGTNFQEKLLRYAVYPRRVSDLKNDALTATNVLITDRRSWSFDEKTSSLTCGDLRDAAIESKEQFVDGSILFTLKKSQ